MIYYLCIISLTNSHSNKLFFLSYATYYDKHIVMSLSIYLNIELIHLYIVLDAMVIADKQENKPKKLTKNFFSVLSFFSILQLTFHMQEICVTSLTLDKWGKRPEARVIWLTLK